MTRFLVLRMCACYLQGPWAKYADEKTVAARYVWPPLSIADVRYMLHPRCLFVGALFFCAKGEGKHSSKAIRLPGTHRMS